MRHSPASDAQLFTATPAAPRHDNQLFHFKSPGVHLLNTTIQFKWFSSRALCLRGLDQGEVRREDQEILQIIKKRDFQDDAWS